MLFQCELLRVCVPAWEGVQGREGNGGGDEEKGGKVKEDGRETIQSFVRCQERAKGKKREKGRENGASGAENSGLRDLKIEKRCNREKRQQKTHTEWKGRKKEQRNNTKRNAERGDRTPDHAVKSRALYRLS